MTKSVWSDVVYKSKLPETTQMPIYRRMDKLKYIHILEYYTSGGINEL